MEKNNEQKLEEKLFQEILKTKQDKIQKFRMEQDEDNLERLRESIIAQVKELVQNNPSYKFTEQQRKDYMTVGGTPHLDGDYTVFGEVIEGLDVVEKITKVKTGPNDRPETDVKIIRIEVL